jgi:DNA-binding LacI/PurR family transcriptional regulator
MIGHTEASSGASYVDYDFEAAVDAGMAHLVSLGHRNIAYVSPTPPHEGQHGPTSRALRAYTKACHDLDLPTLDYHTDQSLRHVHLMTSNMLTEHPEISAFMTIREMVETALYSAVHQAGLRVPDDISILGLTTPNGPQLTSPALTSMEFPAWSMAYEAGCMMIDQLEGVETELKEILREPTLVVQASTSPARPRPETP